MFGFRKCTRRFLMLTWSFQGLLQNQSLETILICIVVLCFPHNNIACFHLYDECKRSNAPSVCHKILSSLWPHEQVCSQQICHNFPAYSTCSARWDRSCSTVEPTSPAPPNVFLCALVQAVAWWLWRCCCPSRLKFWTVVQSGVPASVSRTTLPCNLLSWPWPLTRLRTAILLPVSQTNVELWSTDRLPTLLQTWSTLSLGLQTGLHPRSHGWRRLAFPPKGNSVHIADVLWGNARFSSILSLRLWWVLVPLSWFPSYWRQCRSVFSVIHWLVPAPDRNSWCSCGSNFSVTTWLLSRPFDPGVAIDLQWFIASASNELVAYLWSNSKCHPESSTLMRRLRKWVSFCCASFQAHNFRLLYQKNDSWIHLPTTPNWMLIHTPENRRRAVPSPTCHKTVCKNTEWCRSVGKHICHDFVAWELLPVLWWFPRSIHCCLESPKSWTLDTWRHFHINFLICSSVHKCNTDVNDE